MSYIRWLRLWSQSSQYDHSLISENCDHDRSPHKMHYLWESRPWSQSSLLKLRPWSQYSQNVLYLNLYEDCDCDCEHGHNLNKMTYFWVFVKLQSWSHHDHSPHKSPISESVLIENYDHESQFSYQHCHHQQTHVSWHRMIPNIFQI